MFSPCDLVTFPCGGLIFDLCRLSYLERSKVLQTSIATLSGRAFHWENEHVGLKLTKRH